MRGDHGAPIGPDSMEEPMTELGEEPYEFQTPWSRLMRQNRLAQELRDYVTRTWYTHERAHAHVHHESSPPNGGGYYYTGVPSLQHMNRDDWLSWQGREREVYIRSWSREVRVAFRMCQLAVEKPERYGYMKIVELEAVAAADIGETEGERTSRLRRRFDAEQALVKTALKQGGLPAVFDIAGLSVAERVVLDNDFSGRAQSDTIEATGTTLGTIQKLRNRGLVKLRALALPSIQEVA